MSPADLDAVATRLLCEAAIIETARLRTWIAAISIMVEHGLDIRDSFHRALETNQWPTGERR